jgi:hypothetical protein
MLHDTEFESAAKAELSGIREEVLADLFLTTDTVVLSGEAAQPHLERLRHRLEAVAQDLVKQRSSFEWLWYLRRLGGQFNWNELPSTDPYCQALAEALCEGSTAAGLVLTGEKQFNIAFPIDEAALSDLARLREIVGLLYENHSTTRWAGKSSDIRFTRTIGPKSAPTEELLAAVRLYDRRDEGGHNILAPAGLAADVQSGIGLSGFPSVFPVAGQAPGTAISPAWHGTLDGPPPYGIDLIDLSKVDILTNQQIPVETRWPSSLPALLVLSMIVLHPLFNSVAGVGNVYRKFGYCYFTRDALVSWLDLTIDVLRSGEPQFIPHDIFPEDAEAVIRDLAGVGVSLYPPSRGRILHTLGHTVVVDLEAASHAIFRCLERPVNDGEYVNRWGDTFELHIQDIIDDSPWAPGAELGQLRGRTLRLGEAWLTNIDALGALDGTLLLVSCKSRPFTQAYDRGDYGEVRNVRTLAENSVSEWQEFLRTVQEHKVGDNYDFSGFSRIVGVVVLPFAPFVFEGSCTAESAPGLRWVSSSQELRTWCALS